jgi:hypothetical protein
MPRSESGASRDSPLVASEGVSHEIENVRNDIREGRFQRALALIAGGASLLSGIEVSYEHYRGSYSQRVMYTPVILSGLLGGAGIWGYLDRTAARTVLRFTSGVTLADAVVGFYFHVRGIGRKPGGWGLPITNIVMGPPVFAPLLFGTAAYLGLIASFLRREEPVGSQAVDPHGGDRSDERPPRSSPSALRSELITFEQDIREGRFQQHMLMATALSAVLSGAEAWYSHYKNRFRYAAQWAPVLLAPLLALACCAAICRPKLAKSVVPALSATAMGVAGTGFFYHARGIVRRPGGVKHLPYNIMYGPPIFAPLLFGAAGSLGLLAALLRRSDT